MTAVTFIEYPDTTIIPGFDLDDLSESDTP